MEKLLGAVPETKEHLSKLDRSRSWLKDRRRERARKSVRRRVKRALQYLWDIETRLVSQGLAFTPVHRYRFFRRSIPVTCYARFLQEICRSQVMDPARVPIWSICG